MKYALVTGGSRGIGRAICLKLAEMGYQILINYQSNDTEAEATLQQIREQGSDGELMKFDVTDAAAAHAALNGWMEQHPDTYIEVLVNNAGIRRGDLMLWMEQDEWSRVLDISLNGFFNVTQPLLKICWSSGSDVLSTSSPCRASKGCRDKPIIRQPKAE